MIKSHHKKCVRLASYPRAFDVHRLRLRPDYVARLHVYMAKICVFGSKKNDRLFGVCLRIAVAVNTERLHAMMRHLKDAN